MYFIDHISLGKAFANKVSHLRGKDAVILCLQDSALLTCLSMAMHLRSWVYPLLYVPVYSSPLAGSQALGAFNEELAFCPNPDFFRTGNVALTAEQQRIIDDYKTSAVDIIQKQIASYEMTINKQCMHGRDVVLVGDVVTSSLSFAVATALLQDIRPKSMSTLIGNATPNAADAARRTAEKVTILDILSGPVYHLEHYFDRADDYSPDQKRVLTKHIAAYWE